MADNLNASEYPLSKIFSSDYNYQIPSFQRPYSWTTDQAGTLFDDLFDFMQNEPNDQNYFLGSIVLVKNYGRPDAEIIDGQQRLTTLTILFATLFPLFSDCPDAKEALKKCLYEEGNVFLGIKSKARLTIRERDSRFFEKYILGQNFEDLFKVNYFATDAQKHFQENCNIFVQKIRENIHDSTEALKFVSFLMSRCYLVVVATSSEDSAFRIFSVLNNRGLSLLPSDIIKANIIGNVEHAKEDFYTKKWEDLEEMLGRDGFNSVFGHIRMIYTKTKQRDTLVKEFMSNVINRCENSESLIDDIIEPYANAYYSAVNQRFESSSTDAEVINANLQWLNKVDDSDWLPPIMYALVNYENDTDFLIKFTTSMERLTATMYLTSKTSNYRIERYVQIIRSLESNSKNDIINVTELELEEKTALLDVLGGDVYLLPARKRTYALLRLNSFVSDQAFQHNERTFTIEHVLPQNPDKNSEWCIKWTAEEREFWKHKIANLIPLTRRKNSQAQNYDFQTKKEKYFKGKYGTSSYALATQILNYSEWTPEIVSKRQDELLHIMADKWSLN